MVTERQKSILEALVREYVAVAQPVSSGELVRKYRLPYSPATVRNELLELDRGGLIFQPHTSAGRVPTDKGYRFFIETSVAADDGKEKKIERAFSSLLDIEDEFDFLRQTSRLLSQTSREFSMAGFLGRGLLYKSGLAEVLSGSEFADENAAQEFGEFADFLDDEIQGYFKSDDSADPVVFIGEENPIREARNYTLMISRSRTPFGEEGIFAILGPRRMDYENNLTVLRVMRNIFNK